VSEKNTGTLPVWNLADLYASDTDPAIAVLWPDIDAAIAALRGAFAANTAPLETLISRYEHILTRLGRVSSYAGLRHAAATGDEAVSRFYAQISELVSERHKNLAFFTHGLIELPDPALDAGKYNTWLTLLRRHKAHQLPLDVEEILIEKSLTSRDAFVRLFDETLAGLRFDFEETEATEADVLHILSTSTDRARRANAAATFGAGLEKLSHSFTLITNTLAKDWGMESAWRKFDHPADSRHLDNQVSRQSVDALTASVVAAYPALSHRYYQLKAKGLGLEKLAPWDRNAPWPGVNVPQYSWAEAQDIVLQAFGRFHPLFQQTAALFFANGWIDAAPRPGKDSGAFSHPVTPDTHPYILMNYYGSARDVMTLAHELGHGVHQYLAREQGYLLADTPLTLAETASIFGEMLTFDYLRSTVTDTAGKKALLTGKIEDALNTVVRQIAFHQFETAVHERRANGELSFSDLGTLWLEIQRAALGDAFSLDDSYKTFWMYIPHFIHTPFYVYAYAYADGVVNSLYARYTAAPNGFADKLVDVLRRGGSVPTARALAPFGLNPDEPTFWDDGLKMISALIDELEAALKDDEKD